MLTLQVQQRKSLLLFARKLDLLIPQSLPSTKQAEILSTMASRLSFVLPADLVLRDNALVADVLSEWETLQEKGSSNFKFIIKQKIWTDPRILPVDSVAQNVLFFQVCAH